MTNKLIELEKIKIQYNLLTEEVKSKEKELENISVTNFVLNPQIVELTSQIAEINKERASLQNKILEYDSEDN